MVVAPSSENAQVKRTDVRASRTQKSASLLGLDFFFFGTTTVDV